MKITYEDIERIVKIHELSMIKQLQEERDFIGKGSTSSSQSLGFVSKRSSESRKIFLFRSLTKGREGV